MKIVIEGQPPRTTQQTHRVVMCNGKPRFYHSKKLESAYKLYYDVFNLYKPKEPLSGPIRFKVVWYFKAKTKKMDNTYKTTSPDTDNLDKALKDCLTRTGFWIDDALVAEEHLEKRWSINPRIEIEIEEIKE